MEPVRGRGTLSMSENGSSLELRMYQCKDAFNLEISRLFKEDKTIPSRLKEAMGYSLEAGGKRLRPFLCMAGAELAGCPATEVMPMAMALEMFHTASLIHDDLPCMDDDPLRRGKPSNHIVFGECLATLAGDSLLLWAFETAIQGLFPHFPPGRVFKALKVFAQAIGPSGVCAGQVLDTDPSSRKPEPDFVREIALLKTGTLIRASVLTGGILGGLAEDREAALYNYGTHLGDSLPSCGRPAGQDRNDRETGKNPGQRHCAE